MNPTFWLERWQKNEIGFHQDKVQPALIKHWPGLKVAKGARVFVPLCGKSLDMEWLAAQGHNIIGAELSEAAIDSFFIGCGLTPSTENIGAFKVKRSGPYEMWCGDFFALSRETFQDVPAAYDRAALVAMPPDMQARYAVKFAELMPANSQTLLIGLDYNSNEMKGPPFAIPRDATNALFKDHFEVSLIEARDGLTKSEHLAKRGITRLEEASYLLRRRA